MEGSTTVEVIRELIAQIAPIIAAATAAIVSLRNGRLIKRVDYHVESRLSRLEWLVMRLRQRFGDRDAPPPAE